MKMEETVEVVRERERDWPMKQKNRQKRLP